jgi:hypothetical protein
MPIPRSVRRLLGATALAVALTAGLAVGTPAPAQAANPVVGSAVCHVSQVYGLQCGTVNAVNLTLSYPGGVVYGVFRYNACAGPRDAGTAVYQQSTGQQIGEVIVGSSSCVTYALPVF